jgi:hypothetical protein
MIYEIKIRRPMFNAFNQVNGIVDETLSRARNYGEAVAKLLGYARDLGPDGISIINEAGDTVHVAIPLAYTAAPMETADDRFPF